MDITPPIPLTKLPRNSSLGSTQIETVYAVRNGVKRRRKEICAAVDGDSLSIYEIQNGNVIASHPVPPSSRFVAPPCSIRRKIDGQNVRTTYCALKRQDCRLEFFKTSGVESARSESSSSTALRDQRSPVVLVDVAVGRTESTIFIVQQNGILTNFSEDLQTTLLEAYLVSRHSGSIEVLAVQCLTPSEAQKTIFRQRPDVINPAAADACYLAVAYALAGEDSATNNLHYGVWVLDNSRGTSVPGRNLLLPLFEHELRLGGNKGGVLKDNSYTFNPKATSLFVRAGSTLVSYDLTGLTPLLTSTLHTGFSGSYEIMAISSSFAICSYQDSIQLYDLKYQSVQAQRDTKQVSLKRKRTLPPHEGSGPIQFVAYYPQSARVIGRRRHQLLAIDISAGPSRKLLETGSHLLQNIGRGASRQKSMTKTPGKHILLEHANSTDDFKVSIDWHSVRLRLDELAQTGDVGLFEEAALDIIRKTAAQSATPCPALDGSSVASTAVPTFLTNYLLSKLFRVDANSSASVGVQTGSKKQITVQIPSFELILWLSSLGLLSSRCLRTAIGTAAWNTGDTTDAHPIAQSLLDADPSFALLTGCLANGFSPYVEEQAALVQLLLQRALETPPETEDPGVKAQAKSSMDLDLPSNAHETQMQPFSASSSSSDPSWLSAPLQGALIAALDRFGTAAASTVSCHLKASFSQREILALTQFLRQQLFQAGHTRSFQSHPMMEEAPRSVRLDATVKVLSGCIDAIGPLGFLDAMDNEDFIGNIIPELATEITNTKQGLEDVSELQGILRETLRYQESIQRQRATGSRLPPHATGHAAQQRPGAIVTVYSEPIEGEEHLEAGSVLPLSLKVENIVSPLKIRKGGGQVKQRSVRQKRMLERRTKGEYAFERLVL